MQIIGKNLIRVYFEGQKDGPASSNETVTAKPTETKDAIDTTKLDTLTKEMLEEFLRGKNRNEATELLKKWKEKIKSQNNNPKILEALEKRERTLLVWSNYNGALFGSSPDGEKKNISTEHIDALNRAIGIDQRIQKTPAPDGSKKAPEKQETPKINPEGTNTDKETKDFIEKNPIQSYKQYWIDICIQHPQQIKDNNLGSLARMFGGQKTNSLSEESRKIQQFKDLPSEYKAFIETLINITKSTEFGRYTGIYNEGLQKGLGRGQNIEEFQKNFRNFMNLPIQQKRTLTKEDFDNFFDKKRGLTPEEEKYIEDRYQEIQEELKKIDEKGKQLARLDEIKKANLISSNSQVVITKLDEKLHSLSAGINTAPEGGFFAKIKQTLSGSNETKENWEMAQKEAEERAKKEGQQFFVRFNTDQNKYEIISESYIKEQFSQKEMGDIEKTTFQGLVASHGWEKFFEEKIGEEGTSAIGAYMSLYPDTVLLQNMEPTKAAEVKSFFDKSYQTTVVEQSQLINQEKTNFKGKEFGELFPSLKDNPKITPEMQKALMDGNVIEFYNLLAQKKEPRETYGTIKNILAQVESDAKNLKKRLKQEILEESKEFKGKKIDEYRDIFKLDTEEAKKKFEKIKDKDIGNGELSSEERTFLLSIIREEKKNHPLYNWIQRHEQTIRAAKTEAGINQLGKIVTKHPIDKPANALRDDEKICVVNAEGVGVAATQEDVNKKLSNQNSGIAGLEKFDDVGSISREIHRLRSLGELSEQDQRKLAILESRLHDKEQTAVAINSYINSPGIDKKDAIEFIRDIADRKGSDKEIQQWIEGQQFISKYVSADGKFVDSIERNAAYMNLGETKTIGEIYNIGGMNSSANMGLGFNTIEGMNTLMNCRIEISGSSNLSRTIRDPDGNIIAKDIPLSNIQETLQQLGRFYSIGLGSLAPKMLEVNTAISSVRSDSIGGTNGTYSIQEDKKFLTIMATMLYGEENIPKERNIPNLLGLFNRTEKEKNPTYILKQKDILDESGTIKTVQLENSLKEASKKTLA